MKCARCQRDVKNGIIENGEPFCSKQCAHKSHYDRQDALAHATGFHSYEDMMEHYGATVVEEMTPLRGW